MSPSDAAGPDAGIARLDGVAWLDGVLYRPADAPPLIADRGLLLGDGLYETVLVRDGRPLLLDAHLQRLIRSAAALELPLPVDLPARVAAALAALLSALPDPPEAALRITVTRGSGPRGLDPPPPHPALLISLDPFSLPAGPREIAAILDRPRIDPEDLLAGHKTTSAMRSVIARLAARRRGADLALLRTIDGDIAEADSANLFAVLDGGVVTPPLARGILPGITRAFALQRLATDDRPATERPLTDADLHRASELIITSSVRGVRALKGLDGRTLPEAASLAAWLDEQYRALALG